MITNRLSKKFIQLITYILIIAFLGQNFAWAGFSQSSERAGGPGMLMPDSKGILNEFTESFANVPDPCKAWITFNSCNPSFIESIEGLTADEKTYLKKFIAEHRNNLPGCALLLFSNLLGGKPLIEQEIAIRGLETRMLAEDYPDRLLEEYKVAVMEWERSLKASKAQDKRKNFKILINAYNDSQRLNRLLESIYEELMTFEYGKGIEISVIEHSDKPEECDLNRRYVELWNAELQKSGRTDWMFRYVSLEEQYGLVKEINRNTGVNIETEFLYCPGAAQKASDLAGRGFASAVNMALLWAQTKIDPEDKDSLVMFFDQDVEIGALISGDNGIRKRKITHTFHHISRAFDDMEVNMLACRLNGDPANSLDGLIGGQNQRGAFHSFRHFLQNAIEAEDIDSMCDFWEYFYATEDDPERLSYRDMMQRMFKELENIKGGKYTAFKMLHNRGGRKPVTESGRSDTAPFGTGFVLRPDIVGKVPLFNVLRGSDIYYQIFLKYFVENRIYTINIPVIHNKNPELNKPLIEDLPRMLSSNIGGNSTHLWVNRKIANEKGRVEGLFTHPDMIRLEAGADTEFVGAFIRAFKSDLRKYLLEAEKIYELLHNPALDKFGIDLGQAKAFFSEFIRAAGEVLNIDEGEYCSDTAFDTMAQMQEWPEKIQLWQELMGKINDGLRKEEAAAGKEEADSTSVRDTDGRSGSDKLGGWIPPMFTGETMGAIVFVAVLTWQNNPQLVYIKDIWNYLMLRIWDIRRRLGLVKVVQPEEPEIVESGPSLEEPEVVEEVASVAAVDIILDTNSTPYRRLRNLRNRMNGLLNREVVTPEELETVARDMEVLLVRYEHLHLTNQPLYQEFEELRQAVEALLQKAAEPEPELEEASLPVEKPPSPEPESRPRRRRPRKPRRNVWADLMPGPERDMGMYLEGRFRPAIVRNMVEEGMRYIKRGVLRGGAGAEQLAEYMAILRENNLTGQRQKPVLLIYHEGALFRAWGKGERIVGTIPNLVVLKRGYAQEGGMGYGHIKKHFSEFEGMSEKEILDWLVRTIKEGKAERYSIIKEKKGLVENIEINLYRPDIEQIYKVIITDDYTVITFYTEYFQDFGLSETLNIRHEEALILMKRLTGRVPVKIDVMHPEPADIEDLVIGQRRDRSYREGTRKIRRRIYYYQGTAKRAPFIGIWNHDKLEMILMDFRGNVFDVVSSNRLKGYHRTEITNIIHRADMHYLEKNEGGQRRVFWKGTSGVARVIPPDKREGGCIGKFESVRIEHIIDLPNGRVEIRAWIKRIGVLEEERVVVYGKRASPKELDNFKRVGIKEIDNALNQVLGYANSNIIMLEDNDIGIDGIGTVFNESPLIGIHHSIFSNSIAQFHELAHIAGSMGLITEETILNYVTERDILETEYYNKLARYSYTPQTAPRHIKFHYALRALQRERFGDEDKELTRANRNIKGKLLTGRRIYLTGRKEFHLPHELTDRVAVETNEARTRVRLTDINNPNNWLEVAKEGEDFFISIPGFNQYPEYRKKFQAKKKSTGLVYNQVMCEFIDRLIQTEYKTASRAESIKEYVVSNGKEGKGYKEVWIGKIRVAMLEFYGEKKNRNLIKIYRDRPQVGRYVVIVDSNSPENFIVLERRGDEIYLIDKNKVVKLKIENGVVYLSRVGAFKEFDLKIPRPLKQELVKGTGSGALGHTTFAFYAGRPLLVERRKGATQRKHEWQRDKLVFKNPNSGEVVAEIQRVGIDRFGFTDYTRKEGRASAVVIVGNHFYINKLIMDFPDISSDLLREYFTEPRENVRDKISLTTYKRIAGNIIVRDGYPCNTNISLNADERFYLYADLRNDTFYVADLTDSEREVLRLRLGTDTKPGLTFGDISKQMHCKRQRIQQLEEEALRKWYAAIKLDLENIVPQDRKRLFALSVDILPISKKARNVLSREGISTIEELFYFDLKRDIKGMGKKVFAELEHITAVLREKLIPNDRDRKTEPLAMQSCPVKTGIINPKYNRPYKSEVIEVNGRELQDPGAELNKARKAVELYKQRGDEYKVQQITVNGVADDYYIIEYEINQRKKYFVVRKASLDGMGYDEQTFLARLSHALALEDEIADLLPLSNYRRPTWETLPEVLLIEEMSASPYLGANCVGDGWIGVNTVLYTIDNQTVKDNEFERTLTHELWHECNRDRDQRELEMFLEKHDESYLAASLYNLGSFEYKMFMDMILAEDAGFYDYIEEIILKHKMEILYQKLQEALIPIIGYFELYLNCEDFIIFLTFIYDESQRAEDIRLSFGNGDLVWMIWHALKHCTERDRIKEELLPLAADLFAYYFYVRFHKDIFLKEKDFCSDRQTLHEKICSICRSAPAMIGKDLWPVTQKGKVTLDVGSGFSGLHIISESEPDETIWLLDNNPFITKVLETYVGLTGKNNIRVIDDDMTTLSSVGDGEVSFMVADEVFEYEGGGENYLDKPRREVFFRQARRVLDEEGIIRISHMQDVSGEGLDKVAERLTAEGDETRRYLEEHPAEEGQKKEELLALNMELARPFDRTSPEYCAELESAGFKIDERIAAFVPGFESIRVDITALVKEGESQGTFSPGVLEELDEILTVHNKVWKRNMHLRFNEEQMQKFIEKEMVYVLKIKGAIRGVLLTYPMNTSGDLSAVDDYPLWQKMVNADVEEGPFDTLFFWAIGTHKDKSTTDWNLGQIFADKAGEYFRDVPYISTFSLVLGFEKFEEELRQKGIPKEIIDAYGIYLYLVSLREEGYEPYLQYILKNGFILPEEFFKQQGKKIRDLVENFHVGKNGAVIAKILPQREGFSRSDSPWTVMYGYKGFEDKVKGFQDLLDPKIWVYFCDNIEVIRPEVPPLDKPIIAVFDVHGTLLQPTWKEEYRRVYEELIGEYPADGWIERYVVNKHGEEIINTLSRLSGKSLEYVGKLLERIRQKAREKEFPPPIPGALDLIRALKERGVPIVIVSGSRRERIIPQLENAGFLEYISEENIVGRYEGTLKDCEKPREKYDRGKIIEALKVHYPSHTIAYFDDWISGIAKVKEKGGICFGIPQGDGKEFTVNRDTLVKAGVNYILRGWNDWESIDRLLTVPPFVQEHSEKIPVAEGLAQELVTVLPAPRHSHIGLHIKVSDDPKEITYSIVEDDSEVFKPGGTVDYNALKLKKLITIPSSYLITPQRYLEHNLPDEIKALLLELLSKGKRYTCYRGITTSWDINEDIDVWTTNIDTAFLHKRMEELGILGDPHIKNVIEIGTGGGHLSATLADSLPNLEQLSITDISIYALRTAKRCIDVYLGKDVKLKSYWGKGIRTVEGDADLIIVNPPYIPTFPFMENSEGDPYRGTGLIREILEVGVSKLNPENPDASIIINISSMAQKDFQEYVDEFGGRFIIKPVGEPQKVPLKIWAVTEEWREWLVKEGGLEFRPRAKPDEEPYWHTIQVYRIRAKKAEDSGKSKIAYFDEFYKELCRNIKKIYPYWQVVSIETLRQIVNTNQLPAEWPGLVRAMRADGIVDEGDFEIITKIGWAVEQADFGTLLTVSEKAMLTETISIKYLIESAGLMQEFERELRNKLNVLGYGSKADRIIALLAGLKKKGRFNRRSHFDFVKKLEKLSGREDIFKEIGINRNANSRDIMGNGDDSVTRYWADIFELNGKQWEVLELVEDKDPRGIIVQDLRDFGPGAGNWLEGIRRHSVDMSNVRMAYIIDDKVSESDRQKLIAEKPDNVILAYSLQEIRKQSDNIVYLAAGEKLSDHIGTGIKLVEKGHAGPVIELSLCLLMLATDNTRGAYKEFLNKMALLDLISREQVGELSDPYYIKLPDVRAEVLKMWKDLEQGTSLLDFWA